MQILRSEAYLDVRRNDEGCSTTQHPASLRSRHHRFNETTHETHMDIILLILKAVAVLIGASMLGNWFLAELRSAKRKGLPWYAPYLSAPGMLIIVIILVFPVLAWFFHK